MNNNGYVSLIIVMLLLGCTKENNITFSSIEPILPNPNYKLNLQSNSGENIENVTITWNETNFKILIKDSAKIITPIGFSQIFVLNPGEFKDIVIELNKDDSTYVDTIQIYTRDIYPVTNLNLNLRQVFRGNGVYDLNESFIDLDSNNIWNNNEPFVDLLEKKYFRELSWIPTEELENNFQNYNIFRSENAEELINIEECNNCKIIFSSVLKSDSVFVDSSLDVIDDQGIASYYYLIQVVANSHSKNSYLYNYFDFLQPGPIQLSDADVSSEKNNYIEISWESITNIKYFYQYEIYRALSRELSDTTLLAIIPNSNIEHFQDRSSGNGTTWYYSIAVVDISGRRVFSEFISGCSMP